MDDLIQRANDREQKALFEGESAAQVEKPDGSAGANLSDVQVPEEATEEWYSNSWSVIMKNVEQGDLRTAILDLRTLFLSEGGDFDSRFARPTQRRKMEQVILDWYMDYNGNHPGRLLHSLFELNKNAGYEPEQVL